ncbi:MAG TPA: glycosyltransferase [Thermoleophilaceae bacterium]
MDGPIAVSVVVASHARELRLRWLLNALEEQTFDEPWELVIVHDYDVPTAERVIERHPLAKQRPVRAIAGSGGPGKRRNVGWRAARGELIAFIDDDCRAECDWLERLIAAAREHTGHVIQGRTRPDPFEAEVLKAPHVRTLNIEPVNAYRETCNILYPRELLERLDGFDERAITGEDVDLSLRAIAAGARISAAPDAVAYHAIESFTLPGILRQNLKWRHLAYLVKQHPELRAQFPLHVFWDEDHLLVTAAAVGLAGARRHPLLLVLAAPYVRKASRRRGGRRRDRALALAELPGQAVRQFAEVLGMAAGSVRHGTLLL